MSSASGALPARRQVKPRLAGEACVHAASPLASCDACLSVCPHEAWQMALGELSLDQDACDGCGLCRAVCPEQAIELPTSVHRRKLSGGVGAVFAACERSGASPAPGTIPCVHALRHEDLERWSREDVREIYLATGDCDSCPRGRAPRFERSLAAFNAITVSRAGQPIGLRSLPLQQWQDELARSTRLDDGPDLARRNFLQMFTSGFKADADAGPRAVESTQCGKLARFVPTIDLAQCTGCDACANLCPHGAICKGADCDSLLSYHLVANNCTGCGLCRDVCAWSAVSIEHNASIVHTKIEFDRSDCVRCGAPFQIPRGSKTSSNMCGTCRQTHARNRLFQVHD